MNELSTAFFIALAKDVIYSQPLERAKVDKMIDKIANEILSDDEKDRKLNRSIVLGLIFNGNLQLLKDRLGAYSHFYEDDEREKYAPSVEKTLQLLTSFKDLIFLDESIKYSDLLISRIGQTSTMQDVMYLNDFYYKISDEKFVSILNDFFNEDLLEVPTAVEDAVSIVAKRYNVEKIAKYLDEDEEFAKFIILDKKPIDSQKWAQFCRTLSQVIHKPVDVKIAADLEATNNHHAYNEIKSKCKLIESLEGADHIQEI